MKSFSGSPPFPEAARSFVNNAELRANLRRATTTIREKRNNVITELPDLEQLRVAAAAIKDAALGRLDELLEQLETEVTKRGGQVHYAASAKAANEIAVELVVATGATEVVKVKSMTTAEIGLNEALADAGIDAGETDLAELIVQLGEDLPSHIVVPAIHRNRAEIRSIFLAHMGEGGIPAPSGLSDDPAELAGAARAYLRERFVRAKVAISGANFAVAKTGSIVVVESEGNGRMCVTLPETLISVVGIDKLIPSFTDLEVFLQLLARSATGERMNPYTSIWSGVTPGDGPRNFHLILLDNGRSSALADRVGRQALRCIRCAACLNVCPVYERVGGHAYGSVYPGPIGAVLTPQLHGVASDPVISALPFASTLCGACYEVCPVRIDIPRLLVHLRSRSVRERGGITPNAEDVAMAAAGYVFSSPRRLEVSERLGSRVSRLLYRGTSIHRLPGPLAQWTAARDAPLPAAQSFRDWWRFERSSKNSLSTTLPVPERLSSPPIHFVQAFRALIPPSSRLRTLVGGVVTRRLGKQGTATVSLPNQYRLAIRRTARLSELTLEGRSEVLAAVRRALATSPFEETPVPRLYRRSGTAGRTGIVEQFAERLDDYRADVIRVRDDQIASGVALALNRAGSSNVIIPNDFPPAWLESNDQRRVERDDGSLGARALDDFDAAVSGCAVAIAETGTIILDGGKVQGRRALSLMPDHLVLVVRSEQLVATVPEAVGLISPEAPQTWISGPSATSDIELKRVEGVHGPRRLCVIIGDSPA